MVAIGSVISDKKILKWTPQKVLSYIKFDCGNHLDLWAGKLDKILEEDYERTIPPKFGCNWLGSLRQEDYLNIPNLFSTYCNIVHLKGKQRHKFWRGASKDIPPKFGPNWLSGFEKQYAAKYQKKILSACSWTTDTFIIEIIKVIYNQSE